MDDMLLWIHVSHLFHVFFGGCKIFLKCFLNPHSTAIDGGDVMVCKNRFCPHK